MREFLDMVLDGWKRIAAHGRHVMLHALLDAALLLLQGVLWKTLYARGIVTTATFEQTLTYVVLGSTVLHALHLKVGSSIVRTVRDGTFRQTLFGPMPLFLQHIARELGAAAFHLAVHALPLMLLMQLFFGLLPPVNVWVFLSFLLTVLMGRVIAALVDCVLGYMGLWTISESKLIWLEELFMAVFGGSIIPMWFYPDWLGAIAAELPFKYIKSAAVNLYLGRTPADHMWEILIIQLIWIAGLLLLERALWIYAQNRIAGHEAAE